MRRVIPVLVLVLILAPATVLAEGVTVRAGLQSVSFGADLGKYYDISPGVGLALMADFDLGIPLSLTLGRRTTNEGNSGGDVLYTWIELGPRIVMGRKDASIRPDLFAGLGSYSIEIDNLKYDTALGGYAGLGVEEYVSEHLMGRFEVKGVYWKSDTFSTDAATLNMSLLFGYKF